MTDVLRVLPCPFCGSEHVKSGTRDGTPYTDCRACHATVYFYGGSFWNMRAALSAVPEKSLSREEAERMARQLLANIQGMLFTTNIVKSIADALQRVAGEARKW